MKKTTILALGFLLATGGAAFGQASLPTTYSGPWKNTALPAGWSTNVLGTDYADNYDGVGGGAAKLDSTGDWIQIYLGGAPSTVVYYIRANTLSGAYVFSLQESVNGSTWTNVKTYTSTNNIIPTTPAGFTNGLSSSSRYVRFLYVTKVGGNVGIDGVTIAGPGVPSVSFSPNGTTNAPVSNVFTMAVSILPSGAGLKSWSMAPAYSGSASLTGGTFSFTPASVDNGKTFTVSVVATNSVGTTTGTTTIAVTPYVAPVPKISFSPAAPYSIMATYTQKLGVGVSPAGSGISGWTLLPSNYAGTASLSGTNFTFVAAQTDGPSSYVFSVVATNVYGATTGTAVISVSAYVEPPPAGSVIVDFEDAPDKTTYSTTTNTLSGRSWLVGSVFGTLANDKKFDLKALRVRCNAGDNEVKLCSLTPIAAGINEVSLWFASYGNDGTNEMPQISIEISTNLDDGWITVDTFDTGASTSLVYRTTAVNVREPVYFRLRAPQAGSDKRANVDNITISPYAAPTGYDAFLLKYNATPGDPGTGPTEDLDGDGISNTNEFIADTNPFLIP